MRISVSVDIARPPEAVFRFVVTEFARTHPKWAKGVSQIEKITEGPLAVGSSFRRVRRSSWRTDDATFRVTKLDVPSRFAFARLRDKLDLGVTFAFEPTRDGGTKVAWAFTQPSPVLFTFLEGWTRRRALRRASADLVSLKEILESPDAIGGLGLGASAGAATPRA